MNHVIIIVVNLKVNLFNTQDITHAISHHQISHSRFIDNQLIVSSVDSLSVFARLGDQPASIALQCFGMPVTPYAANPRRSKPQDFFFTQTPLLSDQSGARRAPGR